MPSDAGDHDLEHREAAVRDLEAGEQHDRLARGRDAGAVEQHQEEDPGQAEVADHVRREVDDRLGERGCIRGGPSAVRARGQGSVTVALSGRLLERSGPRLLLLQLQGLRERTSGPGRGHPLPKDWKKTQDRLGKFTLDPNTSDDENGSWSINSTTPTPTPRKPTPRFRSAPSSPACSSSATTKVTAAISSAARAGRTATGRWRSRAT